MPAAPIGFEQQIAIRRVVFARRPAGRLKLQPQARANELRVKAIDRREIAIRQRHPGFPDQLVQMLDGGGKRRRGHRLRFVEVHGDLLDVRVAPGVEAIGRRPSREEAEKFRPVARRREEGLEQEVEQQVVAADVDDEGRCGTDARDIREILVGADADIDAAGHAALLERRHDVQVGALVRDQVVGVEVAIRLGQLIAERRERGRRRRGRRRLHRRSHRPHRRARDEGRAERECAGCAHPAVLHSCHAAILHYYCHRGPAKSPAA